MKRMISLLIAVILMVAMIPTAMGITVYSDVEYGAWYSDSVQYVSENGLMQGVGYNQFAPDDNITRAMVATVLWRLGGEKEYDSVTFIDVDGDWFETATEWCWSEGIVKGYPLHQETPPVPSGYGFYFAGDNPVTREELACFLYRYAKYAGADVSGSASLEGFADAASVSDWAEEALGWCVAEGILQGTPAGDSLNLAPADHATRAEVAAMLMRYCQMIGQ